MCCRKTAANPVNPARSAGRNRRGVLSFGYLFFAQAKKSNSLAAASETRDRRERLLRIWIANHDKQAPRLWLGMTAENSRKT
jgi:hypothetical protein